jgi:hypothetical protein
MTLNNVYVNGINEEYLNKFQLSENENPFINPQLIETRQQLYTPNLINNPTVSDPLKEPERQYQKIPEPPVITYSKMKWNTKTSLNNPLRPFTVSGQYLSFTKNLILPRRTSVLTNNVSKIALTDNCYTPVNNQVVVVNNNS